MTDNNADKIVLAHVKTGINTEKKNEVMQAETSNIDRINKNKARIDSPTNSAVNHLTAKQATVNESDLVKINRPDYVVGIGASAGGLEALEELFSNMPYKTGMAYVVIQHLSPDYKSMMAELLARKTMIPIKVAVDQMVLEADTIYLLPPKKEMITANGRLLLTDREYSEVLNLPINTFFRSLAETYQEKSIAMVLSGTGSDGSKGIVKVHDSGGFVIAQTPDSCKFESMPVNAIKTNKVDLVFNPESMPDALVKYSQRTTKVEQQLQLGHLDAEVSEFSEILILLNNRFDLDFSQYKPSTITRRLERRVSYQKSSSLKDYIDILLTNKEELEALYYDLLIGVTQFFRDPAAFNSLRTMIPTLLETFKDEPEIRIWVAACASGQEAYSMAMMMQDIMKSDPHGNKPFKIFATDIHNLSIKTAAAGIYSEDEVAGLEEDFQSRFFTKTTKNNYQIIPEIRKSIVFAQHNLLKDPPFTRTHLLSCRNLLIYFNNTAQQQVLSLFSFSLLNQGIMFMGPSEALGAYSSDFEMIDTVNRLFKKTRTTSRPNALPLMLRSRKLASNPSGTNQTERPPSSLKSKKALEILLQKYVPASVLVDEKGDILHVFGEAGRFLTLSFGSATLNITALVGEEARVVLSQMLHRIGRHYKPIRNTNVKGFNNVALVDVEMHVLSDSPADLNYLIISLREVDTDLTKEIVPAELVTAEVFDGTTPYIDLKIKELEEELLYAQESLQTTVEELETSNEELQASNEELMASNEELQSTNEELQSVNEELFTVNGEFQQKDLEREELRSDERSIIEESNLGILFLDHDLKIRKLSPLAAELFKISTSDFGQPFAAAFGSIAKEIQNDVYSVFHSGVLIEREIADENGLYYLVRINAYKSSAVSVIAEQDSQDSQDNQYSRNVGVVITFTNITQLYATQSALEKTQQRFNNTLNAVSDGYFEWNINTNDIFFSSSFYQILGYGDKRPTLEELLGEYSYTFKKELAKQPQLDKHKIEEPLPFITATGEVYWMICIGEIQFNEEHQQTKLIGITIDFSKQKNVENKLQYQAVELERSNNLLEKFAYIVSHDMKAPIRHIQNYLIFLQEAIAANDKKAIQEEIQGIQKSSESLKELVDDVITYARVTSEKKKMGDVDINAVIDYVLNTMTPVIEKKNILVNRSDFPSFKGDKSLLTHLLQNLIGNACKYTGKNAPVITIGYRIEQDNHIITVADNGIGFAQSDADNIFVPFNRLVTKDEFEGSGIGLSICKTVIEQHKGTIAVISEIGVGSTFTVALPI